MGAAITILKDRVRELRPDYLPPDPASRTVYEAGHRMQCDLWFPPVDVPVGHGQVGRPPVLVMVSGYSRVMAAVMIPSQAGPGPDRRALALLRHSGRCRGSWSGITRARSVAGGVGARG